MLFFDPMYFLFLAPGLLLAAWAQWKVHSAYQQGSQVPAASGVTGAQAADLLLRSGGVTDVRIEPVEGFLSDHYVPGERVLRLSPDVYAGRSLAALGIAACLETSARYLDDPRNLALLEVLDGIAAAHDVPVTAVSLAWLRSRPSVTAPIASARTPEQLPALVASFDLQLTDTELDALTAASAR